jgi:hypothetical protein
MDDLDAFIDYINATDDTGEVTVRIPPTAKPEGTIDDNTIGDIKNMVHARETKLLSKTDRSADRIGQKLRNIIIAVIYTRYSRYFIITVLNHLRS